MAPDKQTVRLGSVKAAENGLLWVQTVGARLEYFTFWLLDIWVASFFKDSYRLVGTDISCRANWKHLREATKTATENKTDPVQKSERRSKSCWGFLLLLLFLSEKHIAAELKSECAAIQKHREAVILRIVCVYERKAHYDLLYVEASVGFETV